ncbi:hypothetical protein ACJJTC_018268 [Scirpophaga incertulas]
MIASEQRKIVLNQIHETHQAYNSQDDLGLLDDDGYGNFSTHDLPNDSEKENIKQSCEPEEDAPGLELETDAQPDLELESNAQPESSPNSIPQVDDVQRSHSKRVRKVSIRYGFENKQ